MNPFYAMWYYIKKYRDLIISILLVLIFILFIAACGDDDIRNVDENIPPNIPDRNEVTSYCSKDQSGVRIYLSDVYYGINIAVISDPKCP